MDDFYREMAKCDLSHVPVITGDLADTWIHGVGSYPGEVSLIRDCRERARRIHSACFGAFVRGEPWDPALEQLWNQYYEASALFSEHTWGADVKTWWGLTGPMRKKSSWPKRPRTAAGLWKNPGGSSLPGPAWRRTRWMKLKNG